MMKKRRYKKGELGSEKLVTIVLIVIVIILMAYFLYNKSDITNFWRFLPEYKYPENDTIIIVEGSSEILNSKGCPTEIGSIVTTQIKEEKYLINSLAGPVWLILDIAFDRSPAKAFMSSVAKIYINKKETKLIWYTEKNRIVLYTGFALGINRAVTIGRVDENKMIFIYPEWINDAEKRSKFPDLPTKEELQKLDGAYFYYNNDICRVTK